MTTVTPALVCLCGKDVSSPMHLSGVYALCTRCHSLGPPIHALVDHLNYLANWREAWKRDPAIHHANSVGSFDLFIEGHIKLALARGEAAGSLIIDQMIGPRL